MNSKFLTILLSLCLSFSLCLYGCGQDDSDKKENKKESGDSEDSDDENDSEDEDEASKEDDLDVESGDNSSNIDKVDVFANLIVEPNDTYGEMPDIPDFEQFNYISLKEGEELVQSGAYIKLPLEDGTFAYIVNIDSDEFNDYMQIEEEYLKNLIEQHICKEEASEITDRDYIKNGDTVRISYVGTIDGVAFDGGTGSYDLKIGSGAFIDGFEEQLIGAKKGEIVDVIVTFPSNYGAEEVAGQEAVFKVTIEELLYQSTRNDITDEDIADYFMESGRPYIDTYEKCLTLLAGLEGCNRLSEQIRPKFYVGSIDTNIVISFYNDSLDYYEKLAATYNMTFDEYLEEVDVTLDEVKERILESAVKEAMYYRCLQAIARYKNIVIDENDILNCVHDQGYESEEDIIDDMKCMLKYIALEYYVAKSFYE